MAYLAYWPCANNIVSLPRKYRFHKKRNVIGTVLIIRICIDNCISTKPQRIIEPGHKGSGKSHVTRLTDNVINTAFQVPLYAVFDTFAHWGDFARIQDFGGIPTFIWIPITLASSYYLIERFKKYNKKRPHSGQVARTENLSSDDAAIPLPFGIRLLEKVVSIPRVIFDPWEKRYGIGLRTKF